MERQLASGLIVHDDVAEALAESSFTDVEIPGLELGQLEGDVVEGEQEIPDVDDWLEALRASNKERVQKHAAMNAYINPSMLIMHMLMQLAEMSLSEEGLRELSLRQENFIARVLDNMDEDVPNQRARDTLTQGVPHLNRAQRRALAKLDR